MSFGPWLGLGISTLAAILAILKDLRPSKHGTPKSLYHIALNDRWALALMLLALLGGLIGAVALYDQKTADAKLGIEREATLIATLATRPVSPRVTLVLRVPTDKDLGFRESREEDNARKALIQLADGQNFITTSPGFLGRAFGQFVIPSVPPKNRMDDLLVQGASIGSIEFVSDLWMGVVLSVSRSGYLDIASASIQKPEHVDTRIYGQGLFVLKVQYKNERNALDLYFDVRDRFDQKEDALRIGFFVSASECYRMRNSPWARRLGRAAIRYDLDNEGRQGLVSELAFVRSHMEGDRCVYQWRLSTEPRLVVFRSAELEPQS